ncbi:MAG: homoserine kinase [Polaromonas sp.]|nr:homoserine kinase [Polaromonas sp.]
MAVYTEVSLDEAAPLLQSLGLGELQSITACAGGIENTNYFVDSDQGRYVLTLFERLSFEQLPFYLYLMKHLAQSGIPVPEPQAVVASGAEAGKPGDILLRLKGKPAAVVNRLRGRSELAPMPAHCAAVGETLARMHLAGRDFGREQPNLRGLSWWNDTVPVVLPHLDEAQSRLILGELVYQNHIAATPAWQSLPRGAIHADLFRDNVMFDTDTDSGSPVLTGFFDFYFAGCDTFLFDIGVSLNDWCVDLATGAHDAARADAFLAAYQAVRPLTPQERTLLPAMQRAGALRFWISRLWDLHLPREAAVLQPHDPTHFERVLRERVRHPQSLSH